MRKTIKGLLVVAVFWLVLFVWVLPAVSPVLTSWLGGFLGSSAALGATFIVAVAGAYASMKWLHKYEK